MIPKFKEVLCVEDLDPARVRDALKTLNELVHHQETADMMIEAEILQITANLLLHENGEVREQAALLLAEFAHSHMGRQLFDFAFPNLKDLLEDPVLSVREACAYAYQRMSVNDDGCQRMVHNQCLEFMIHSFINHCEEDILKKEDAQYLIYLLEAFINLTFSDLGIEPLLGKKAIETFTKILDHDYILDALEEKHAKVAELSLRVLGNMSINHEGKNECIENKVIERSYGFLIDQSEERSYDDALNTSLILMSCSIHLDGKKQIVNNVDGAGNPLIIQAIIARLQSPDFVDIRTNLKVALTNIAELPDGFSKITNELVDKIEILDEVFGPRAIKPLHNFLPKLSEYDNRQNMTIDKARKSASTIRALAYLFKKYKDVAAQVAVDETINFAEKLAPFINPEYNV